MIPLLLEKVLLLMVTSPAALIVAPIRRLSSACELKMDTLPPLSTSRPVSSMKPGDSVVFALKVLFAMLTFPAAVREAPHRKLSLAITPSRSMASCETIVKPYPRNSLPRMDFVPENSLWRIDTRPAASMVAPAWRFPFASTWNRVTSPSVIISRPRICLRAVSGVLKLLSPMATLPTARMIAPAVLFRSKFDFRIVTFPPALSSAPAPLVEFVTLTLVRLMFCCVFRLTPVWAGFVIVILFRVSEPPHGLPLLPMIRDTLLNVLVPAVEPVDVFQPPVMVRLELLMLLRL